MIVTESLEGTVKLAQKRFADAVHQFVDRTAVWEYGVMRWQPGLYARMRDELTPGRVGGQRGRRVPASRTPCRTGVLDWLRTVDSTVGSWGSGGGTVHSLKDLAARQHRPQDTDRLNGYAEQLAKWAVEAATILNDAVVVVPLRKTACPSCGARLAFRQRDGHTVRSAALTVSELGAECAACSAKWTTDQLPFLATLIG